VTVTTPIYSTQVVGPASDTLGAMFLQIPGLGSRDLEDVVVTRRGAEEWIRFGSSLYRPQATIPALAAGPNAVTFVTEGYAEWRLLPVGGTVEIATGGASSWRLYDPDLASLDAGSTFPAAAQVPKAGCYLLLFGSAGASTTVSVAPAAGAQAADAHTAAPRKAITVRPESAVRLR
jgi:hypothetical protein